MNSQVAIFYILSAMILGGGIFAVTTRRIFRAAVYLLFSLIGIAGMYFYLQAQFIAAVQIIVYVGGIVVLIIFSIFLTQQSGADLPPALGGRRIFAFLATICGFLLSIVELSRYDFHPSSGTELQNSVAEVGQLMLNTTGHGYALPFEVISILLLAAMVGCIVIAIKTPEEK